MVRLVAAAGLARNGIHYFQLAGWCGTWYPYWERPWQNRCLPVRNHQTRPVCSKILPPLCEPQALQRDKPEAVALPWICCKRGLMRRRPMFTLTCCSNVGNNFWSLMGALFGYQVRLAGTGFPLFMYYFRCPCIHSAYVTPLP